MAKLITARPGGAMVNLIAAAAHTGVHAQPPLTFDQLRQIAAQVFGF